MPTAAGSSTRPRSSATAAWADTEVDTDAPTTLTGASFGAVPCAISNAAACAGTNQRGDSRYIGFETDMGITYRFAPGLTFDMVYGHLFAARALGTLKRQTEAASHLKQALALFPNAQSALIAASQFALVHADASGAIAPMQRLSGTDPETRGDPWWHYHTGVGRYADALLKELWDKTTREGS